MCLVIWSNDIYLVVESDTLHKVFGDFSFHSSIDKVNAVHQCVDHGQFHHCNCAQQPGILFSPEDSGDQGVHDSHVKFLSPGVG
jgi:hypothetical protein